jgi:hypothetical protein
VVSFSTELAKLGPGYPSGGPFLASISIHQQFPATAHPVLAGPLVGGSELATSPLGLIKAARRQEQQSTFSKKTKKRFV